jgi:hypothetical protein
MWAYAQPTFIRLVVCLRTGPKPLPNRALHIVRSSTSSFKCEYPLLSLRSSSSFLRFSSSSSCHFYPPFYLSFNNALQKAVSSQNVTNTLWLTRSRRARTHKSYSNWNFYSLRKQEETRKETGKWEWRRRRKEGRMKKWKENKRSINKDTGREIRVRAGRKDRKWGLWRQRGRKIASLGHLVGCRFWRWSSLDTLSVILEP